MRGKLGDRARLNHILDSIVEIETYLFNVDFETFIENSMMRFACIKQMEIIGEASNHISEELKALFTDIEWNSIKGMRNVLVHEYFGIDTRLIWEIIKYDLPELKTKVIGVISSLSEN
jgi:uncharacterized protein with HEPN domain